ncbi:MAG: MFS transporter, partial [Oscillospiraceae bacterium]|nr:MFS transporter [Oscillospiraceae bacterium]
WSSFGLPNDNSVLKTVYFVLAYIFFTTSLSLMTVPHESLLPELAPEYSLRVHYNSALYVMNSVGMMGSFFLAATILGFSNTENFTPDLKPKFLQMALIMAVPFALALLITFFSTKEDDWREVPKRPFNLAALFSEYKLSFKSRAFRQYIALPFVSYLCINIFSTASPFFLRYVGRIPARLNFYNTIIQGGQMTAFPVNYWLSLKHGKQSPAKLLTPLIILGCLLSFFISPTSSPDWAFYLQAAAGALVYIGYAGMGMTPSTTFPDTTDVDEMVTGRRREGVLAATNNLVSQIAVGIGQAISTMTLGAFKVDTNLPETDFQSDTAIIGLRIAFAVLPALLAFSSIILTRRYKMRKTDHELLCRAVAEKKETGAVRLTADERAILEDLAGMPLEHMWIGQRENLNEALGVRIQG